MVTTSIQCGDVTLGGSKVESSTIQGTAHWGLFEIVPVIFQAARASEELPERRVLLAVLAALGSLVRPGGLVEVVGRNMSWLRTSTHNKAVKPFACGSLGRSALRACSGMASPFLPDQSLRTERRLPGRLNNTQPQPKHHHAKPPATLYRPSRRHGPVSYTHLRAHET